MKVHVREKKQFGLMTYIVVVNGVALNEFLSFELAATKAMAYQQHLDAAGK